MTETTQDELEDDVRSEPSTEQEATEGTDETAGTTYLCAQLWTPTPRWLALSEDERYGFLDELAVEVNEMTADGVDILGFAINDGGSAPQDAHRYIAMWKLPSETHLQRLEETVSESDWGEYFDQVMVRGELVDPCYARMDMIKR